jgi:hypothetical protein
MLNYITVTPDFTYAVSNVETYVVAFNYEPSDSEVASFVYQNKGNDFDYSIIQVTTGNPVNILQRHTNTGAVEHVTGSDTHLYLVSLIDGVSDARNETMKQVLKI